MIHFIKDYIYDSIETKKRILNDENLINKVYKASSVIVDALSYGKKILIAGNGGSAADAQHIAAEFVSRFYFDREGLSAIALTVDSSVLTAIGNDYGFEHVFARQIEANGAKGDVFIGITTSGTSQNIINAVKKAREKGIATIIFTGEQSTKLCAEADIAINVPSRETPKIQESHIMIGHIICAIVEKEIFTQVK